MTIDPPIAGLIGAILGASIGGLATSLIAVWKYKIETRTEAYRALIETSSQMAAFTGMVGNRGLQSLGPKQQGLFLDLLMQFRSAKAKVALYGSPEVLSRLGAFTASHARMEKDADADAYIAFIAAMRKDSFAKDYPSFSRDVDRLMVRDEMQVAADGTVSTMRDRLAAKARHDAAAPADAPPETPPPETPPPPPPAPHTSFSYSIGPKA